MYKINFITGSTIIALMTLSFFLGFNFNNKKLDAQVKDISYKSSMQDESKCTDKNIVCIRTNYGSDTVQTSVVPINPMGIIKYITKGDLTFKVTVNISKDHIKDVVVTDIKRNIKGVKK